MQEEPKPIPQVVVPNKGNGQSVTMQATADEEADTQPQLIVLEPVDRLMLENYQLKLMNAGAKLKQLEGDMGRMQQDYLKLLAALSKKYGFDPALTELEPETGRVVPRGTVTR